MSTVRAWGKALRAFVDYEAKNGRARTMMKYNPASSECVTLNYAIPSIFGEVDVDWMLRIAPTALTPESAWLFYRTAKFWWNMTDPREARGDLNAGVAYIGAVFMSPFSSEAREFLGGPEGEQALIEFNLKGRANLDNIENSSNGLAPLVAYEWIGQGKSLAQIFQPALALCEQRGIKSASGGA